MVCKVELLRHGNHHPRWWRYFIQKPSQAETDGIVAVECR